MTHTSTRDVPPYPADRAARYRDAGLWEELTIPQQFRNVAAGNDRVAVRTAAAALTYRELDEQSDGVATGLLAAGLQAGDAMVLQVGNSAWTVVAWYGMLKAGVIPVCTLAVHRRHEIEEISRQTQAVGHLVQAGLPGFDLVAFAKEMSDLVPSLRLTFTIGAEHDHGGQRIEDLAATPIDEAQRRSLIDLAAGVAPQDVAVYQLSGGTTAVPKVIPRLHCEYWYNAAAIAQWWNHDEHSVLAFALPLVHNAGVANALHAAHAAGAELLLAVPPADVLLPLMAEHGATWTLTAPGLMAEYLKHPLFDEAFAKVSNCVISAAPAPRALFDAAEARGVHIVQAFGMSEGLFIFTPPDASPEVRATTVGVPISPLDEVEVLVPGGIERVPDGQIGELCARGPYTVMGYLNAAERNAEAFTSDGFYRTGDLVRRRMLDGVRALSIEGRVKDLINRGGEKVNAEEIERLLLAHADVADVALVAMPDPRLGERACAYVVAADTASPPTLADLCLFLDARGVTKFKWPERLELIDALPRTSVGKVSKVTLRSDVVLRMKQETDHPATPR